MVRGGAILSATTLNITADGEKSIFKGNYTKSGDIIDDNAIYSVRGAAVNFNTKNNGSIQMYDNIRGDEAYSVNITGDGSGTFGMYNDMYDANLSVGNTNLNTVNNQVHTYNVNTLTLTADTNLVADVDLKK